MSDILIRNLDGDVLAALKRRAASRGRSLQQEARQTLTQAVLRESEQRASIFAELDGAWGAREASVETGAEIVGGLREEAETW